MAKKGSAKAETKSRAKSGGDKPAKRAEAKGSGRRNDDSVGEAFIKLLQSPLVADLVAVAATAALASLAEHGFSSAGVDSKRKRTGKAVKEAGKAAAAAVGRRLNNEIEEIRKAAKGAKD